MTAFSFSFDLADDLDESFDAFEATPSNNDCLINSEKQEALTAPHEFAEISLSDLLSALPEAISYSILSISSPRDSTPVKLARRDLYDARFQVMAAEKDADSTLDFLDAPSDLLPWQYEGGLKTWECSVDLATHLDNVCGRNGEWVRGKRVLEIGCGTAVPTLLLLHRLFHCLSSSSPGEAETQSTAFHLQDYNHSVLELVTLPNILLAWYNSPLASTYRTSEDHPDLDEEGEKDLHLDITSDFIFAFKSSLTQYHIDIRFFSGSWDGFDVGRILGKSQTYDVVLSSETIYRSESIPALLRLLHDACTNPSQTEDECTFSHVDYLCLVAAKVLYFGVGGGLAEFIQAVESDGQGRAETVWEQAVGVARRILRITWTIPS